ncbi:MAG TPA: glycine cleavage system protein GcvH, partial [Lachnoclostridium phytofermentans]|nr:glycine cleavage system protein GcvH [Lachnoclostridium phytofermentans]
MKVLENLVYTKTHEWVRFEDETTALVGLTDYAQQTLGQLVFVNLPEEGDETVTGESFADVESVKAVSDVYCPVTGVVSEINEELLDAPEKINETPYE